MDEKAIENIINEVIYALHKDNVAVRNTPAGIPVGVSNRHIHLNAADITALFGEG
ncbi:MAG: Phosphate propanoyltransferase, partial [Firmicutes bacterium]|nr:Phosphate propanoyltransferase [Bacillota bacterium]